jgi:Glucose / Sorbosone dehydrogenase
MFISVRIAVALVLFASTALAQPLDPFPDPIPSTEGLVRVAFTEFASLPDVNGDAARMMLMVDEPGTRRLFVNDMRGILYSVSYDGKTVTPFLDLRDAGWSLNVQAENSERGLQSFAFHPDFNRRGARGFGKFYTYLDTANTSVPADFTPGGGKHTQDTILLEWTAKNPAAATYDGAAPRELMRFEQPFANHNGGHVVFNPLASSRDDDFGLLYIGSADGGSGGDPLNLAQNPRSAFGKILRIDPLGSNSANGKYGIPPKNPFAKGSQTDPLPEVYASGVRNPQRFFWDSKTRRMFLADIGQNIVEEISPVTAGANLGWNAWEGSFAFNKGTIALENRRAERAMTYPVVEYAHADPLFLKSTAVTGGVVYRQNAIRQLKDLLIFGDNPSGEIFYIHADKVPAGGQDAMRRILFDDKGEAKTLLQLIQAKNTQQGKKPAPRADLRFGSGPNGQVFVLNKRDGTIRLLVADGAKNKS